MMKEQQRMMALVIMNHAWAATKSERATLTLLLFTMMEAANTHLARDVQSLRRAIMMQMPYTMMGRAITPFARFSVVTM